MGVFIADEYYNAMMSGEGVEGGFSEADGEIVHKLIDNVPYTGQYTEKAFNSVEELQSFFADDESELAETPSEFSVASYKENGNTYCTISLHEEKVDNSAMSIEELGIDGAETAIENSIRIVLDITFPYGIVNVVTANKDSYQINGNTININLLAGCDSIDFSVTGVIEKQPTQSQEQGKTALDTSVSTHIITTDEKTMEDTAAPNPVGVSSFVKKNTYHENFADVCSDIWYHDAVAYAYELGIISGVTEKEFAPEGSVTLAELITVAARIRSIYDGETIDTSAVSAIDWYKPYVNYATKKGIISEYGFLSANFEGPVSRSVTALVFEKTLPIETLPNIHEAFQFPDVSTFDPCYATVIHLYQAGIVNGAEPGLYKPGSNVTRAQLVTFVQRLCSPADRL